MLKTIRVKRVTEEIISQIHDQIARGELTAGDRLPSEREMALQLGVSRPTLREAMQVLEHTGFVEIIQGSGIYIRDIGKEDLTTPLEVLVNGSDARYREVYEFRASIEIWAAGLAAERIQNEEIEEMGKIIESMKHCRENKKPVDTLDAEFHLSIARACHNTIYYLVARTILHLYTQATRISHSELFLNDTDQDQLLEDHEALYKAIASRDAVTARTLMRTHLDRVSRKLNSSL